MKELLIVWLTVLMAQLSPPDRPQFVAEAKESKAQAEARYREIAEAILDVSFNPAEEPLFTGANARSKTALFIMFKFYKESSFRRDVHLGLGRARLGRQGWNDNGRSWCMGQIMLGRKSVEIEPGVWAEESSTTTAEGWTGTDLVQDTRKCAAATLHILRKSFGACAKLPPDERLAAYATGSCSSEVGRRISRSRMADFHRLAARAGASRPQATDPEILAELNGLLSGI